MFYAAGLAPSTKAAYKAGQKKFLKFCTDYKVTEVYQLLKSYYVTLFHTWVGRGWPSAPSKDISQQWEISRSRMALPAHLTRPCQSSIKYWGALRFQLRSKQGRLPRRKLPVTPTILRQIRAIWSNVGQEYDQTLLWAASTVCFFGFLRAGELSLRAQEQFDPNSHLSFADVATNSRVNPTFIQLSLKTSKTDPFRNGTNIIIGSTQDALCPVTALFGYLKMKGNSPGPLFAMENGTPLTRSYFVSRFRSALHKIGYDDPVVCQYSGHSFRAGAASTAAAMGMKDSLIKTLGRWECSAYLIYLRLPREDLQSVSKRLAQFNI